MGLCSPRVTQEIATGIYFKLNVSKIEQETGDDNWAEWAQI